MGIYGWLAKKLVANQNEQILESNELIIEMEVDKSFIDFIKSNQEILKEDLQATVDLKDGNTKVSIIVRDRVTVTTSGGCSRIDSCSFKISGPDKVISKTGKIDIIIPGYDSSKDKEKIKPYVDKKIVSKFKGGNLPAEVKLALKFAEDEQKFLRLIYNNPESENQKKLFRQMIKDSDYVINFKYDILNHKKG